MFENPPIGPAGSGWTSSTESGYLYPTTFIVPSDGFYLLTYKIDVRSGSGTPPSTSTTSATVLTRNNQEIAGSTTLVVAPESNHIYTISNTVLVQLFTGDNISLMFWTTDLGANIGEPSTLTGQLPFGLVPAEASASIVFTRIN
jgi:hypothetical protein